MVRAGAATSAAVTGTGVFSSSLSTTALTEAVTLVLAQLLGFKKRF
jgi:hypothetical protein